MPDTQDSAAKLITLIKTLGLHPSPAADTPVADLGDSLETMDLAISVEGAFGLDLGADEFITDGALTVSDVARRIDDELARRAPTAAPPPDLLSVAKRWLALDAGAWNGARHTAEKEQLLFDTRAAVALAESSQ